MDVSSLTTPNVASNNYSVLNEIYRSIESKKYTNRRENKDRNFKRSLNKIFIGQKAEIENIEYENYIANWRNLKKSITESAQE